MVQMDEDDLEDLRTDYHTRPKQIYQRLTRDMMMFMMIAIIMMIFP